MSKNNCNCQKNYCFYNEIRFAFCDHSPSKDFFANPNSMKRFLKIGESDQIEINHIPTIENKIKVSISIVGDYEYTSENKYPKRITLRFYKGHYSLKTKKQSIQKTYPANLTLTTFFKFDDHFLTYNGEDLTADYTMTDSDLRMTNGVIFKMFQKSQLTDDEKDKLTQLKDTEEYEELVGEFMVSQHDTYIKNIENLKDISGIDISDNGFSIKQTALNLVAKYFKPYQFQELDKRETEWYFNTKCQAAMYCAEPTTITGKLIDANSFYSSMECSNKFIVPLGNPQYSTLQTLPEVIQFGIYRAKITNYDKRLFTGNDKNYYTYTDIKQALKRGYSVELIQDGEPNFLHYNSSNRETGDKLFKGFVDMLYPFKKKNPLVKRLLNILWGAFCQKKKQYADDIEVDLDELDDLEDFIAFGEGDDDCLLIKKNEYVHPHARIGVFLTAYGRAKMADYMEDFIDDVYRVHTDGFYTTSSKDFKFSDELGGFKLEDEGTFQINNLNSIEKMK